MLIAMAGLPGTGKSTLAARLAGDMNGVVLNKDAVRGELFPPPVLDFSREQDDLTMAALYFAAKHLLRTRPAVPVVIDGRTFSKRYQLPDLIAATGVLPVVIECVCDDDVAESRIGADVAGGAHPAGNRTFALYLRAKAAAERLTVARLVLDTGRLSLDACAALAQEYIRAVSLDRGGHA